jgi:hypothetical protein
MSRWRGSTMGDGVPSTVDRSGTDLWGRSAATGTVSHSVGGSGLTAEAPEAVPHLAPRLLYSGSWSSPGSRSALRDGRRGASPRTASHGERGLFAMAVSYPFLSKWSRVARTSRKGDRDGQAVGAASSIALRNGVS